MTIPTLSTSDKSFICSYNIGANIDFRLASGVMNEITTYTTEYIEGRCRIPVFAPTETNDHSNFWDLPEKDVVYIKVGCRISSDGYIHTWLMDTQKISELILWNNRYNTTNQPIDDTTVLHWTIEKLYRQVIGNTIAFVAGNIKFQNYVGGSKLYLIGNYNNSITHPLQYTSSSIIDAGVTWYPNNSTTVIGDFLYKNINSSSVPVWTGSTLTYKWGYVQAISYNSRVYECTTGGTTGTVEPSWNTTVGSTTNDGTVIWTCRSIQWKCRYRGKYLSADGWCNFQSIITPWGKSPDTHTPRFWKESDWKDDSIGVGTHCQPLSCTTVYHTMCHTGIHTNGGTGNNSGRNYGMSNLAGGCLFDCQPDAGSIPGYPEYGVDECNNTAYIWVDSYCSGGIGDNQTECEADGGTWIPGHYECDPDFTYDTSISFQYRIDEPIAPTEIDYVNGRAHFNAPEGSIITVCYWHGITTVDIFNEYGGDLDELKHVDFSISASNGASIFSLFTKHVGLGAMVNTTLTIDAADWIVSWGANDYFNSWTTPDGLGARSPGSTQTLLTRPLTHHDGFYTGAIDIEGGFIYEPALSNAFLTRTISNETKIYTPLSHNTGFSWLYESTLSNGFLSRSIDIEAKLHTPISFNTGFNWMYESITSDGFLSRTIDNEIKTEIPLSFNTGFGWLYKFEEPWVSKHRFLKIGGNDADDGLTFATAWEHWSHAMATIAEDGRLYAADGTYSESVEMSPQKAFELFLIDATGEDAPAEVIITPT